MCYINVVLRGWINLVKLGDSGFPDVLIPQISMTTRPQFISVPPVGVIVVKNTGQINRSKIARIPHRPDQATFQQAATPLATVLTSLAVPELRRDGPDGCALSFPL